MKIRDGIKTVNASVKEMNAKALANVKMLNLTALRSGEKNKGGIGMSLSFVLIVMAETLLVIGIAAVGTFLLEWGFNINLNIHPLLLLILFSLALGVAFSFVLKAIFINPIEQLGKAMNEVASGHFETRLETKSNINEIQEIYSNFNLMTKALGSTEVLQTDFVSNVSHEIKTPVNAIEGYTMLLQDRQCTEEEREQYVEKILFNTRRLSELVGNILLLSKIENQAIETKIVHFRVDEQIRQSIMLLEPKWEPRCIDFDVELDEVECLGNSTLLLHVWNNLIGNAVKFSPEGGVVRIRLAGTDGVVLFTVEDDGPGITEEEQQHLFDKFYQGDSSHKQEGNGLGLALVRRILDLCGGEISAENRSEGGCRFTVSLPLA